MHNKGKFVISLDFELNWGVFDVLDFNQYKQHLIGARKAVPVMLHRFKQHDIHATWGVVGFLFFSTKQELVKEVPQVQPQYEDSTLSSYRHIQKIGENEVEDPYHYGLSLIKQIKRIPHQEIATHTFSHYYCLAPGQDARTFEADLVKAIQIAKQHSISIKSLIFPRNQVNQAYLSICEDHGLISYRGCEAHWLYQIKSSVNGKVKRAIRLIDSYINLSGHHIYPVENRGQEASLVNIPSSRFLRPYSKQFRFLEGLKLKRIKASMTRAAIEGKLYHLWWHPHNFGVHLEENIQMLDHIIEHFHMLRHQYGMESLTMQEVSERMASQLTNETKII
ncbi:polysaccharide deacetylase family protein [Ornithinibacillus sp. BX22]|uniref:Polysaccharide deacetylase family protein n=2 Tax=Ornithinibacillus TaxID=484508 RepID=A0A923L7J1_9BACI|nr:MULTISPECIES: polysaccharide deacetylase family protein [Ornithinibacillus]MBC5637992.1 polysaccharide deacetylase family protein [Ornithinibacillus hominis]MBS3681880.1 polysaccharide deacetylase family protein [Ornithinibacillus massiliensis]